MKSRMLAALISSVVIAFFAYPILAAPIDDIVSGVEPNASALPSALNAATVFSWWLSGALITHIAGTVLTFLLALCICSFIAYSSALNARAEDGGVLGDAHVKSGLEVVRGSMTWNGSANPSSRGFVYGFTRWHGKPCYLFEPKKMVFASGATGSFIYPLSICSRTATAPMVPSP
mgnify:CR=1 FL=1